MDIFVPVMIMGALGILFGAGLAIASKKLAVTVDPRLEKIGGLLPGVNCGACGAAGCFGFAEALLSGKIPVDACKGVTDDARTAIAKILGQTIEKKIQKTAVLHCNGGSRVREKYDYRGLRDCIAASALMQGPKACSFGCLGFGTCVAVCPFGALSMSKEGLPVVDARTCKACGKCAAACPKKLFTIEAVSQPVYVACVSKDIGKDTRAVCSAGCIGCRLCEKACKFDAIHVVNNAAVIDYHKCTSCKACVKVCPSHTILIRGDKA